MSSETEKDCHRHFWNLYEIHGSSDKKASLFFQHFFSHPECDKYHDFKGLRWKITNHIGNGDKLQEILYSQTEILSGDSERAAVKAFTEFNKIMERQIYSSLPLSFKFWYHTGHKIGVVYKTLRDMNNGMGIIQNSWLSTFSSEKGRYKAAYERQKKEIKN